MAKRFAEKGSRVSKGQGASSVCRRFPSRHLRPDCSGVAVDVGPARAGWSWIHFAVRQIARGDVWRARRAAEETCLVLLAGEATVRWGGAVHRLGPRASVFAAYPHAVYLPAGIAFEVTAETFTEIADCRARSTARAARATLKSRPAGALEPRRVIRPEDCGYEIRGGGNATRQIVDIVRPEFPADRLMICEVFTPSGNWSSYPPHKHDTDRPPLEADLDEIYYYRFSDPAGYGFQRLYRRPEVRLKADATAGRTRHGVASGLSRTRHDVASGFSRTRYAFDITLRVEDGDVVTIREGYHPFVTAYGYDAYYLNVLAGSRRSMAAADDPVYAGLRDAWPAPDPRLPLVPPTPRSRALNPESQIPNPESRVP